MRKLLRWVYRDWARKPVSGTAVIALQVTAFIELTYGGDMELAWHAMILAAVFIVGRDQVREIKE